MLKYLLFLVLFIPVVSFCDNLTLDHVVIVVNDLDKAKRELHELGFVVKPGRLHPNGLRNAFVKFSDETELEFMTVVGQPLDAMSRKYAEFLSVHEGVIYGVFQGSWHYFLLRSFLYRQLCFFIGIQRNRSDRLAISYTFGPALWI